MYLRHVRQSFMVLTLGLCVVACQDDGSDASSSSGTTSPATSNNTSATTTSSATSSPSTNAVTSSNGVNSTSATSGSGPTSSASGGGATSSSASATDTDTDSDTSTGTTGGSPSGTPYVFTGSTNGTLRAFVMNPSNGSLEAAGSAETGDGLDFIALGPDQRTLFVSRDNGLAAYTYEPGSETFTAGDTVEMEGGGTYVNVDPTGAYVFVASYNEGLLSFFNYD